MAGFKTHITVSSLIGVGYGGAAYAIYGVRPWSTCAVAAGLCAVSGMLPDIDSDSSTPQHESLAFASAVVPMMMMHRFRHWGLSPEMIILAWAGVYLTIRFAMAKLLQWYTVHRGMFHSIPAAIVFGEVAYLLASGDEMPIRIFTAAAVTIGYMSHLVLDEIYSVEWSHGLRLKKSFGTALKIIGEGTWSNVSCYAKLLILTAAIFVDPRTVDTSIQQAGDAPAKVKSTATRVIDQIRQR